MEIRAARESELDAIVEMLCLAFRPTGRERYEKHLKQDSSYRLDQSRVGLVGGKIVSYVRVSDRPMRMGSCVVRMGGVGAVATHPDYRGRGYNTAVLQDAIKYMEREGYDVSMLFTGIHPHYAKLGWAPFPEHESSVKLRYKSVPAVAGCVVRGFKEEDLEAVARVYDDHNRRRTGTLVRSRQYWLDGHSRHMGVLPSHVLEVDGVVHAYLNWGKRGNEMAVREMGYMLDRPDCLKPLAHFLIGLAVSEGADTIRFELPRSHPFPEIVCDEGNGNMSHAEREGMMLRLINLASLLNKIKPELEERLRKRGLLNVTADISLCAGGQEAALHVEGGRVSVAPGRKGTVVELDMRRMCRLLFGDLTMSEMSELNAAKGLRIEADQLALLDALFPRQNPVYWGCDHF